MIDRHDGFPGPIEEEMPDWSDICGKRSKIDQVSYRVRCSQLKMCASVTDSQQMAMALLTNDKL